MSGTRVDGAAARRRVLLARGGTVVVLVAVAAAVAGFVTMDLRAGGFGYAAFLIPVAVLAAALGLLGAALLGPGGVVRTVVGLVLAVGAVAVLVMIAVLGLTTRATTGA